MKTWVLVMTAMASALCTLFSVAPFGFWPAAIASPMLFILIALHAKTTKSAVVWVYLFQVPLWLWLHSWVESVAFAGWIGVGLYMALWAPLFVYLFRRVQNKLHLSAVVTAPVLWVGLECLRGLVLFDGYPWFLAGLGILDMGPIADIATIGSVWIASFLVLAIAALLATIKHARWWTVTTVGCVVLALLVKPVGFYYFIERGVKLFNVAAIQTNVPQSNKVAWSWDRQQSDVATAIELTYQAAAKDPKPELIIWPETMLPGSGFEVSRKDFEPWDEEFLPLWYWSGILRSLAQKVDIPILVGAQTWFDVHIIEEPNSLRVTTGKQFNSAVLVFPDGELQRYDKTFLTPFGERIPYLSAIPALQDWVRETFGAAMLFDLHVGGKPERLTLPSVTQLGEEEDITIATPICFEDTVPSVVRNLVWEGKERKAELLINLSNDGWFGDDAIAHKQHVREARMRCIENRTPMVRVANTGISCYIDMFGRVKEELPVLEPGILTVQVRSGVQRPRSRILGDRVAWLSLIGSILLVMSTFFKRSKEHDENIT
jgi:apolipoprotein N-acyltransferase